MKRLSQSKNKGGFTIKQVKPPLEDTANPTITKQFIASNYKATVGYTGDNLTRSDASYSNTYRIGNNARKH